MQLREIEAMMAHLAPVVREFVAAATAPLLERIAALEARQPEKGERGEPGQDGKDADPEVLRQMVSDAVATIPRPQDGKDADMEAVGLRIAEEVQRAVSGLPEPKQGMDGRDGRDADPEMVEAIVRERLAEAVSAIELPAPEKGEQGERGERGADGADGRDGVGLAGAVIDRDGRLVLTLTDGSVKELGVVVGRDGTPGAPGEPGKDGKDALGIENLDVTYDGERTFTFEWTGHDRREQRVFVVPLVLDRGVYSATREYERGDGVSFGGSYWIAQEPTTDKPETSKAWRLSTKRGQNGKDGIVRYEGPPKPVKGA